MVRFVDSGGESDAETGDGLAPVIPLFGDRAARAYPRTADEVRQSLDERVPAARRTPAAEGEGFPRTAPGRSRRADADAPGPQQWADEPSPSGSAWTADAEPGGSRSSGRGRARSDRDDRSGEASVAEVAEAAERGLLKKLRARELSVSEAKTYLAQQDLDADALQGILDAFVDRGYLDDARAAEQIVHAGSDRKGQGRQAIAQTLAKRGIPRDIADAALAELPDDDLERALEFARSKAGSMRSLERDVALRRLAGQLARRGYGGSLALTAARAALDEAARPVGRVRFEER